MICSINKVDCWFYLCMWVSCFSWQVCCNICLDKCYINKLYCFYYKINCNALKVEVILKKKQENKCTKKQQHQICKYLKSSVLWIEQSCPRRCSLHLPAMKSLGIRCSCVLWEKPLWFQFSRISFISLLGWNCTPLIYLFIFNKVRGWI